MSPLKGARLRLVRGLALAWLLTGHVALVPRELVPWGSGHVLVPPAPLRALVVFVGVACSVLLIAGRTTRPAALGLASTIFALTFASEAYFANNRVFVAAMLAVAVVAPDDPAERALRTQAALVYVGAAIDKLLDPAFRAGAVVAALVESVATNGPPGAPGPFQWGSGDVSRSLSEAPSEVFVVLALATIALELALAAAYVRHSRAIPWLASLLHLGIYFVTGSTFGVFLHAALITAFTLAPSGERRPRLRA
ncbi:MAG: hypothetical protein U0230_16935 [Polyangiales bacterium]